VLPAPFDATLANLWTFSQDLSAPSLGHRPTLRMAVLRSPTVTRWHFRTRQLTLHHPNTRLDSLKTSSPACPSLILACHLRRERRWIAVCCGTKRTLKRESGETLCWGACRGAKADLGVGLFAATTFCTSLIQHWRRCSTRRWRTGASAACSTPPCSASSSPSSSVSLQGESASGTRRLRASL
jgi:hypothetical protein